MRIPESTVINSLRTELKAHQDIIQVMRTAILDLCDTCHTEIENFDCNRDCKNCPLKPAIDASEGTII